MTPVDRIYGTCGGTHSSSLAHLVDEHLPLQQKAADESQSALLRQLGIAGDKALVRTGNRYVVTTRSQTDPSPVTRRAGLVDTGADSRRVHATAVFASDTGVVQRAAGAPHHKPQTLASPAPTAFGSLPMSSTRCAPSLRRSREISVRLGTLSADDARELAGEHRPGRADMHGHYSSRGSVVDRAAVSLLCTRGV